MQETRLRRKIRETERSRSYEGGSSKGRLDIQEKHRSKKRFSNQFPFKFPKALDDRVSNAKYEKEISNTSPSKKPTCGMCCKKHYGD